MATDTAATPQDLVQLDPKAVERAQWYRDIGERALAASGPVPRDMADDLARALGVPLDRLAARLEEREKNR